RRQLLVELAVDRCAPAGRHAFRHHLDHRAHGRAGLAHLVEIARPGLDHAGIGREERVPIHLLPGPARAVDPVPADLYERAADRDAGHDLAGNSASGHAHGGLARAGAPAAAIVAHAVL